MNKFVDILVDGFLYGLGQLLDFVVVVTDHPVVCLIVFIIGLTAGGLLF